MNLPITNRSLFYLSEFISLFGKNAAFFGLLLKCNNIIQRMQVFLKGD